MGRAFKSVGRGARRRLEVRLEPSERTAIAQLLLQVDHLLEDDVPPPEDADDPLAALTGIDPRTFSMRAPTFAPDDPAVARLLPDGNREDPALAEEFRRMTEYGLRQRKRAGLRLAAAALQRDDRPLRLTAEEAQSLLRGLTDLRLVLAERLGLQTDEDAAILHHVLLAARSHDDSDDDEPVGDQPWVRQAALYEALTGLQEMMVEALMR